MTQSITWVCWYYIYIYNFKKLTQTYHAISSTQTISLKSSQLQFVIKDIIVLKIFILLLQSQSWYLDKIMRCSCVGEFLSWLRHEVVNLFPYWTHLSAIIQHFNRTQRAIIPATKNCWYQTNGSQAMIMTAHRQPREV